MGSQIFPFQHSDSIQLRQLRRKEKRTWIRYNFFRSWETFFTESKADLGSINFTQYKIEMGTVLFRVLLQEESQYIIKNKCTN